MRRVAILAGLIGLAIGSSISYFQLEQLARARARHDRFQAFVASPAMARLREWVVAERRKPCSFGCDDHFIFTSDSFKQHMGPVDLPPEWKVIEEIEMDTAGEIVSIKLRTDEVIKETPAPSWSKYAGALAFAPLGFLIPWGFVRLLAWTVAGFLSPINRGEPQ
jgi:hypothetical protein